MIIALDTASTDVSLAVARPDGSSVARAGWTMDRRQAHETLPRMVALLASCGLQLSDASAIAVGLGPGSFTGLRVGVSLAKGLAMALEVPLVGVPSLPAWLASVPSARAALARAGAREAFLLIRGEDEPRIVDREALLGGIEGQTLVAPAELAEAFALPHTQRPTDAAASIAVAAAASLRERPDGDDLERLEPTYLRAPRGVGQVHPVQAT